VGYEIVNPEVSCDVDRAKNAAARFAASLVKDGMILGLGSGTTAAFFLANLAARVTAGLQIAGVPTSRQTELMARELGIPLTTLEAHPVLDLDIDGADEIDPALNILKGGGGALLHEKIVALASRRFVAIVDWRKLVDRLAAGNVLPVEIVAFGWTATRRQLEMLGASTKLRGGETTPYQTDSGNFILDVQPPPGLDIFTFADQVKAITGVVDHGLFRHVAAEAVVGYPDGSIRTLEAP
jgi:ribose 5-phosphate isomerase A